METFTSYAAHKFEVQASHGIYEWAKKNFVAKGFPFSVKKISSSETPEECRIFFEIEFEEGISESWIFEAKLDKSSGKISLEAYLHTGYSHTL